MRRHNDARTTTHRDRKATVRGFADSVTLRRLHGRKQAALGGDLHGKNDGVRRGVDDTRRTRHSRFLPKKSEGGVRTPLSKRRRFYTHRRASGGHHPDRPIRAQCVAIECLPGGPHLVADF
jgi:hypothetical protein